jgi:hypothetical protein
MGKKYSYYSYLTLALDGVNGQRNAPITLYPRRKGPGTSCIRGWVGLKAGIVTEQSTTRNGSASGKRRYSTYSFSTSALDGGESSALCAGRDLPPGKGPPGIHWTGGWVGPRGGLDTRGLRKNPLPLPGIEHRSPSS